MIRLNLNNGVCFNQFLFALYGIKVKITKNNFLTISSASNARLLEVASMTFSPDTMVSVDGAPETTLRRAITPPRKTRGDRVRTKSKRVLKCAPETVPAEKIVVICDGVEKIVDAPKVAPVQPEKSKYRTGNPLVDSVKADMILEWEIMGFEGLPSSTEYKKIASRLDAIGKGYKAEAFRINAKLCDKYFG